MANIFSDEEWDSGESATLLKRHEVCVTCFPRAWETGRHVSRQWCVSDFPPADLQKIPDQPGVYVFVVEPNLFGLWPVNTVFYVGKATKLRDRIRKYIGELNLTPRRTTRDKVHKMINLWNGHLKYYFTVTKSVDDAEEIEKIMIESLIPPFNTKYSGEINKAQRAF
jgi:hypothetical protein